MYTIYSVILLVICVLWLMPLIITISNSFMKQSEIVMNYNTKLTYLDIANNIKNHFVNISLIPKNFTLNQYKQVLLYQPTFLVLLFNSIKITVPIILGNLFFSLLTAYGYTIWRFKYKSAVLMMYVIVMLMPLQAVLVPNFIVADLLNIKTSILAIILPGIFAPFGTFLLIQSMSAIHTSTFEAAEVDNANSLQIFFYIVLPQARSGIAALLILNFVECWNMVDQVVVFIRDVYKQPLSVYLSKISNNSIGIIFAASCVFMFLPLWFLIIGQEDLEKGIELSGVK